MLISPKPFRISASKGKTPQPSPIRCNIASNNGIVLNYSCAAHARVLSYVPIHCTEEVSPHMAYYNRFQALSDGDMHVDPADSALTFSGGDDPIADAPLDGVDRNSQEGWEDDTEVFEEDFDADSSQDSSSSSGGSQGEVPYERENRRKVSKGQRSSADRNIAFDPTQIVTVPIKMGRGGGYVKATSTIAAARGRGKGKVQSPANSLGTLESIPERTETDTELENDPQSILLTSVPPPEETVEEKQTFFTFRAQLTFGLDRGSKVHLPALFRDWVKSSTKHIPQFTLLPFDDPKGQPICLADQVPDDNPSFYKEYYFNHRVLKHGNLTGMVHFRCSVSWNKIKRVQDEYFQWLHWNKVYLNLTKFKTDTLVVSGFLVGAHPGHLRREDAEEELRKRLNLPPDFPFQLSSRTISVAIANGREERFAFPAVAIETSAKFSKKLREAFFAQPKPADAKIDYPYTGIYQFVPMLQSKEWPTTKIFQLAKVHTKMCQNMKVIYLENLQDIRNVIGTEGQMLARGFLGLATTTASGPVQLIHSIHNTGRRGIKAVLVYNENYEAALESLATIHQQLLAGVNPAYHKQVFIDNLEAGLTGSHRDTIHSCNSSHYANELLQTYNPQDAEIEPANQSQKRFRPTVISYAAVASGTDTTNTQLTAQSPALRTAVSSITTEELDLLYERLKHHVNPTSDPNAVPGVSSDELDKVVQESNQNIQQIRDEMRQSVAVLTSNVEKLELAVRKQNGVVVGISRTLEATSQDIKESVDLKFNDLSTQIQELRKMILVALPSPALQAAARSEGQLPT